MLRRSNSASCRTFQKYAESIIKCQELTRNWKVMVGYGLIAAVFAGGSAGLVDDDGGKLRQRRLQTVPQPLGQDLARGVCQPFNLVQVIVIQPLHQRLGGLLDVAVI